MAVERGNAPATRRHVLCCAACGAPVVTRIAGRGRAGYSFAGTQTALWDDGTITGVCPRWLSYGRRCGAPWTWAGPQADDADSLPVPRRDEHGGLTLPRLAATMA